MTERNKPKRKDFRRYLNGFEWQLPNQQGTMIFALRDKTPVVYRILHRESVMDKVVFDENPKRKYLTKFSNLAKINFPDDKFTMMLDELVSKSISQ